MVRYRRSLVPGGTYFFTVTLRDRTAKTLTEHVDLLRKSLRSVRAKRPFATEAMVILPDHLHAIWTLPADDADYSGRWRAIKAEFVRVLRKGGVPLTIMRKANAICGSAGFGNTRSVTNRTSRGTSTMCTSIRSNTG